MGFSGETEKAIANLAQRDADGIRGILLSPEWIQLAMKAFYKRLEDGERDALRIYMESVKVCGAQPQLQIIIGLWKDLGVSGEDEAKRLIRLARQADSEDEDLLALRAADFLGSRLRVRPELTAEVLRRIGSLDVVRTDSVSMPVDIPNVSVSGQ